MPARLPELKGSTENATGPHLASRPHVESRRAALQCQVLNLAVFDPAALDWLRGQTFHYDRRFMPANDTSA